MILRAKTGLVELSGEELYQFFRDISSKKGEVQEQVTLYRGSSVSYEKADEGVDPAALSFKFIFSTEDVDSYGDTIVQDGWDLKRYSANPVILWAHDHKTPAIGFARDVGKAPVLSGIVDFNPEEIDPFGAKIGKLVGAGRIKAGSVGFNPIEWDVIEHKEGSYTVIDGFRFKKQELMEFSICNVPANPFALVVPKGYTSPKTKEMKPRSGGFSMFLGKE